MAYGYYLREKGEDFSAVRRGECPRCHKRCIEVDDERGGGCGPRWVSYRCGCCGWSGAFSIEKECGV
ncbi:hypothetical protein [Nitratifractor sp.]